MSQGLWGSKLPAVYMPIPHHQPRQHQYQVRHEPLVLIEIGSQKDSKRFFHSLANRLSASKGIKLLIEILLLSKQVMYPQMIQEQVIMRIHGRGAEDLGFINML